MRETGTPPVVCVVGKRDSGKTHVTVLLTAELGRRGWRVMTVKHGHGFDLDREGKDSWRHRVEGGARRVALVAPGEFGVVGSWEEEWPLRQVVERFLWDADVVVAEGYKALPEPKIEVFRRAVHRAPLYDADDPLAASFLAVVTDDPDFAAAVPVLHLDDPALAERLADLVESRVLGDRRPYPG